NGDLRRIGRARQGIGDLQRQGRSEREHHRFRPHHGESLQSARPQPDAAKSRRTTHRALAQPICRPQGRAGSERPGWDTRPEPQDGIGWKAMKLKDQVALVTGGSRGIGRAIVKAYVAEGAKVAFVYKGNQQAADELLKEIVAA